MIRINVLEGRRPHLEGTATPKEILEVCFVALISSFSVALVAFGVVYLLTR